MSLGIGSCAVPTVWADTTPSNVVSSAGEGKDGGSGDERDGADSDDGELLPGNIPALRHLCEARGLPSRGTRHTLQKQLEAHASKVHDVAAVAAAAAAADRHPPRSREQTKRDLDQQRLVHARYRVPLSRPQATPPKAGLKNGYGISHGKSMRASTAKAESAPARAIDLSRAMCAPMTAGQAERMCTPSSKSARLKTSFVCANG